MSENHSSNHVKGEISWFVKVLSLWRKQICIRVIISLKFQEGISGRENILIFKKELESKNQEFWSIECTKKFLSFKTV